MKDLVIRPGAMTLEDLQAIHAGGVRLSIDPAAMPTIEAGAAVDLSALADPETPLKSLVTKA